MSAAFAVFRKDRVATSSNTCLAFFISFSPETEAKLANREPGRGLRLLCYRDPGLNGLCGGPDHVNHQAGLGEHGDVAAVHFIHYTVAPMRFATQRCSSGWAVIGP